MESESFKKTVTLENFYLLFKEISYISQQVSLLKCGESITISFVTFPSCWFHLSHDSEVFQCTVKSFLAISFY